MSTLVLTAPTGQVGEVYDIATGAGNAIRAQVAAAEITVRTSPIFIEDYLAANANSIRSATRAAMLANPAARWLIFPPGAWQWTWPLGPALGTPQLTKADGWVNGIRFTGQNTELFIDQEGTPSNQRIMFLRLEEGDDHGADMVFEGIKFSLYNVVTSFSGYAVGIAAASNCVIQNCEAVCTLDASVVPPADGRLRWGFGLFGADRALTQTGGRNNRFSHVTLNFSQIQACAQPRSVDGVVMEDIICTSANDLAVSCVTRTAAGSIRNVLVDGVVCRDVGGAGVVLMGNDGNEPGFGCALIENFIINNVQLTGERNPDTLFDFGAAISFYGATALTRNVIINNVETQFAPNASAQARSILVASQDDEVLWEGLTVANCELGVVTSNDPLQGITIAGRNITSVKLSNIRCKGRRGISVIDCDALTIDNCTTDDGVCLIQAFSRNISSVALSNCRFRSVTGFNSAVFFQSTAARSFSNVALSNVILDSNVAGLLTALTGGTMSMILANVINVSGNNLGAETIAGVIRAVNTPGMAFLTTLPVVVPAVLAGAVGYVLVPLAGTRLATLLINEGITANPQAQLVAAGVGGAFCNARMQAAGVAELAFVGPLAGGGPVDFTFSRTAQ